MHTGALKQCSRILQFIFSHHTTLADVSRMPESVQFYSDQTGVMNKLVYFLHLYLLSSYNICTIVLFTELCEGHFFLLFHHLLKLDSILKSVLYYALCLNEVFLMSGFVSHICHTISNICAFCYCYPRSSLQMRTVVWSDQFQGSLFQSYYISGVEEGPYFQKWLLRCFKVVIHASWSSQLF